MDTDNLLKIIETRLQETHNLKENTNDFIRRIVSLYALQLSGKGIIPLEYLDDVFADIESEAVEIFRKKTYGFLTLEEYRRHKFRSKKDM